MSREQDLTTALTEAKQKIVELEKYVEYLTTPPFAMSTVASVDKKKKTVLISQGGGYMKLKLQDGSEIPKVGWSAVINMENRTIVEFDPRALPGPTARVAQIVDDEMLEIAEETGASKFIWYDKKDEIQAGDTVLLDISRSIVLKNYGKFRPPLKWVPETASVSWEDVGGLESLKEWFHQTLEAPLQHPEIFKFYNMRPPRGVLMAGPPGCGKTLVAKAIAGSIAHGASGGFLSVKGPEILAPFVGVAEERIRDLFKQAREFRALNGFPCVIFIDEAEAILSRRGSRRSSDVDKTIVPAFLSEMDGMDDTGAIVILATNRPEMLDSAVVREGRIDKKVVIPRPNLLSAQQIFSVHLRRVPTKGLSKKDLAVYAASLLFSDELILADITLKSGEHRSFKLQHIVSGAMIATIVDRACEYALGLDLKSKSKTGVTQDALKYAIESILQQNSVVEQAEPMAEFVEPFKSEVATVDRRIYEELQNAEV